MRGIRNGSFSTNILNLLCFQTSVGQVFVRYRRLIPARGESPLLQTHAGYGRTKYTDYIIARLYRDILIFISEQLAFSFFRSSRKRRNYPLPTKCPRAKGDKMRSRAAFSQRFWKLLTRPGWVTLPSLGSDRERLAPHEARHLRRITTQQTHSIQGATQQHISMCRFSDSTS